MTTKKNNYYQFFFHQSNLSYLSLNSALSRRIHLEDLMLDQIFLIEEKIYNLTTVDSLKIAKHDFIGKIDVFIF